MADTAALVPQHIGIIMDGNGRWAELRGKARTYGHRNGISTAKRIMRAAIPMGIQYITLYTFSTENWKRPPQEVNFLMKLLVSHMRKERDFYHGNQIRVLHTGYLEGLPQEVRKEIRRVVDETKDYERITAILAINYGGRDEIIRGFKRWEEAETVEQREYSPESFSRYLDNPGVPDPDLIIRTAGEQRISNFLLWQSAYSEFYFSPKLWPDWEGEDLQQAVKDFSNRKRKFGGTS